VLICSEFVKQLQIGSESLRSAASWVVSYVKITLDHPADVLRHQAREVMNNVMRLVTSCSNGMRGRYPTLWAMTCANFAVSFVFADNVFSVNDIVREVLTWNWHSRALFISLTCCLRFTSVEILSCEQPNIVERCIDGKYIVFFFVLVAECINGCILQLLRSNFSYHILKSWRLGVVRGGYNRGCVPHQQ